MAGVTSKGVERGEKMTHSQEEHLQRIKSRFATDVDKKYRAGAKEHGGNLLLNYTPRQLVEQAIAEAIDQYVYLVSLLEIMK